MGQFFEEMRGKLGFGCMRLPMVGEEVDAGQFAEMVDAFLEAGFNYFDTAHGYIRGKSEPALKAGLTSRYPRERYLLTDKLSGSFFKSEEDIRPLFESQLAACGVEYFDFYLMHAQFRENYPKFKACRAYETAFQLREEGKVRHVGISFHDSARLLDQILTEYPQLEAVQLQLNYLDWEDPIVQSKACYEVCQKHGKPVLVMEPVKGGQLAALPQEAGRFLAELEGGSAPSYALRFAAGLEGVAMVLSGMSTVDQMEDNLSTMSAFAPLDRREREAVDQVVTALRKQRRIPCTACRYCVDGCPMSISIPDLFACANNKDREDAKFFYDSLFTQEGKGKAGDCVKCGACEDICPQHLPIRELLEEVARQFET